MTISPMMLEQHLQHVHGQLRSRGYECEEKIGAGGFCHVWRARVGGGPPQDLRALKIATVTIGGSLTRSERDEKISQALSKEQSQLADMEGLDHARIVKFYESFRVPAFDPAAGEFLVTVWELCESDLTKQLGQLTAGDALRYLDHIADALDYLHRNGFVHRDVKEANILLSDNCQNAKLGDLGMARRASAGRESHSGTPGWSDIRQMLDGAADALGDLYSLALVYVKMITGVDIFTTSNLNLALRQQNDETIIRQELARVDNWLSTKESELVFSAICPDGSNRFGGSCRDWVAAIREANLEITKGSTVSTADVLRNDLETLRPEMLDLVISALQVPSDRRATWSADRLKRSEQLIAWVEADENSRLRRLAELLQRQASQDPAVSEVPPTAPILEAEGIDISIDVQRDILRVALGMNDPNAEVGNERDRELCATTCAKLLSYELRQLIDRVTDELNNLLDHKLPNWQIKARQLPDGTTLISEGLSTVTAAVTVLRQRLDRFGSWNSYSQSIRPMHHELQEFRDRVIKTVLPESDDEAEVGGVAPQIERVLEEVRKLTEHVRERCVVWSRDAHNLHAALCQRLRSLTQ
jgi:serine/threonine protein kinase